MEQSVDTPNELERRIAEAFAQVDSIGDEHIMVDAVGLLLRRLGCVPTEKEIAEFIKATESDVNKGEVHLSKFTDYLIPLLCNTNMKPATDNKLFEAFKSLDLEDKGYLTKEELTEAVTQYGEKFSEEELETMLKTAVDPKTGHIHYEPYVGKLAYNPKNSIYDLVKLDRGSLLKRKSSRTTTAF